MEDIEVELRSFITKQQYQRLIDKLEREAKFIGSIKEETLYLSGKEDLRLRRDNKNTYIILKGGKIHDKWRKEWKVKCSLEDFEKIKEIFRRLGCKIKIKWLRKRRIYKLKDVKIFLDNTEGYGYIIELERMTNTEDKSTIQQRLRKIMKSLGVKITPRKEFDIRFQDYRKNWRKILKDK